MRIVSLVPSLTETICDFGLRDQLVGCTNFCVEPKGLHRTVTLIGGTKDPDLDLIRSLHPTHILANQEENPREPVLELMREFLTLVTFPKGPEDVPGMLRDVGRFLDCSEAAEGWAQAIDALLTGPHAQAPERFLYLIWQNPYMIAGPDTYISRTLSTIGWINAYAGVERYPSLDVKAMEECRPDVLLLSSEPYPFRKRDAEKLREQWPGVPRLSRVDGQLLSWFGTRTRAALEQLQDLSWLSMNP